MNERSPARRTRRDLAVAAACGAFVAVMVGMAYAAVPLYDWFCRTTGFGGTTQVAQAAPGDVLERSVKVRFDGNVAPGLAWRFTPEQNAIDVRLGETVTVYYSIVNETARETAGQASYNVTPPQTGAYFVKINCFCFTDQRLAPGEKRRMPVVFYLDPALAKDPDQSGLNTITLSYTFHPLREPAKPVADNAAGGRGRI
jgi:cytochrome c oxidase assembly protein subunit 11